MITLTTEQAQQIEEALEDIVRVFKFETGTPVEALAVIREQKAKLEKQEPVAWALTSENGEVLDCISHTYKVTQPCTVDYDEPLYTHPVRTKDLTDDEIVSVLEYYDHEWDETTFAIARAVIAADRDKNR